MRVTFAATLPAESPTIAGRTLPLAHALVRRGHAVNLLTLGTREGSRQESGIVIAIVGPTLRGEADERPNFPELVGRLRRGARGLSHALRRSTADVIVLAKAHPQNVLAAHSVTCPLILDADDDERWASRLSRVERYVIGRIERHAARKAALVTCCSPALVNRYSIELRAPRVVLLPTGIAPSSVSTPDLRRALQLPPATPLILYLGSLALSSGHRVDHLLDVWDELATEIADLHLVIAGDGIDANRLRAHAARLTFAHRVHFTGRFASGEAEGLARQATLLVDPVDRSPTSRAKSSSRTLLALLTGVPIVAGDVGIRRHFLPPTIHSWALYPPDHRDRFLQSLKHGLTEEAKAHFRRETTGLWQQWSWDRLGSAFASFVENLAT